MLAGILGFLSDLVELGKALFVVAVALFLVLLVAGVRRGRNR